MDITEETFRVVVRPNARKSEFLGFDLARKAYKVAISEPAEDGKANKELLRFLGKELGKKVSLVSGHTSKIKTLRTK